MINFASGGYWLTRTLLGRGVGVVHSRQNVLVVTPVRAGSLKQQKLNFGANICDEDGCILMA